MTGCRQREQRELEHAVRTAWWVQNLARTGKRFRDLDHYLKKVRPRKPQTADEVFAIFEGFAAIGMATIRQRE